MARRFQPISRRTLLRGAGVGLALPWLEGMSEAMAPAGTTRGTGSQQPVRLAVLYMPNGVHPEMWTPEGKGREFQLSPTLQPLEPFKNDLLVLTNLWNQAAKGGDGHYVKEASILTCTTISKTLGVDINIHGVSMDQLAAQKARTETPLPSLELGTAPVTTGVDKNVGYTRVYGSHIAWSSPTTPLAREIDPHLVFERLFRASTPGGDSVRQDALLLDSVLADAKELRQKLGSADQKRVDEYLTVVRSLEQRLDQASRPGKMHWKPKAKINPAAKPEEAPKTHADRVRLMMDMMALAFQTDSTRVCTFMFGNAVSNENFAFLEGVKEAHHSLSHHENNPDKMRQYQLINRWHVEQYAYLLSKLRGMQEGSGTVLDHSMILFSSALRDGNRHDPHNLPLVVAGRAGGRLATGQHLVYGEDTPLANLYVSMLSAFGAPVERFADSTGPLPGVLA